MTDIIKYVCLLNILFRESKCSDRSNKSLITRRIMEPFVVGGTFADLRDYPHVLYLQVSCDTLWACGASILNQNFLISAAHCFYGCDLTNKTHNIKISTGSRDLERHKILRSAKHFVTHEQFDETTVENDIALAMVDKGLPLGVAMKRLIIQRTFPSDDAGFVAGWGSTDDVVVVGSVTLKQVRQKLQDKQTCAMIGHLQAGMFCAGSTGFYQDHPAEGDSGNALVTKQYVGIGIVSFRVNEYPALLVYANVSYYYKWIVKTVEEINCRS